MGMQTSLRAPILAAWRRARSGRLIRFVPALAAVWPARRATESGGKTAPGSWRSAGKTHANQLVPVGCSRSISSGPSTARAVRFNLSDLQAAQASTEADTHTRARSQRPILLASPDSPRAARAKSSSSGDYITNLAGVRMRAPPAHVRLRHNLRNSCALARRTEAGRPTWRSSPARLPARQIRTQWRPQNIALRRARWKTFCYI